MKRQATIQRLYAVLARVVSKLFGPRRTRQASAGSRPRTIERRFNTAFHMLPQSRKDDLIAYYQRRNNCSRIAAMECAIEDRARDNGLRL